MDLYLYVLYNHKKETRLPKYNKGHFTQILLVKPQWSPFFSGPATKALPSPLPSSLVAAFFQIFSSFWTPPPFSCRVIKKITFLAASLRVKQWTWTFLTLSSKRLAAPSPVWKKFLHAPVVMKKHDNIMVIIIYGNSEINAQLRSNLCYLVCLRHLIRYKEQS